MLHGTREMPSAEEPQCLALRPKKIFSFCQFSECSSVYGIQFQFWPFFRPLIPILHLYSPKKWCPLSVVYSYRWARPIRGPSSLHAYQQPATFPPIQYHFIHTRCTGPRGPASQTQPVSPLSPLSLAAGWRGYIQLSNHRRVQCVSGGMVSLLLLHTIWNFRSVCGITRSLKCFSLLPPRFLTTKEVGIA
jgi:hypothetical protein